MDQLQRPLLPDCVDLRGVRSGSRVRLPDCDRLSRLGSWRSAALRARGNPHLPADPVRGPDLRLGQTRPGMGQKDAGVSSERVMSLLNSLPDYVLTTKTDELLNWMR